LIDALRRLRGSLAALIPRGLVRSNPNVVRPAYERGIVVTGPFVSPCR